MSPENKIEAALSMAHWGSVDGGHHKMWVIDQIVRLLTDCPPELTAAFDCNKQPYTYTRLGESAEYKKFIENHCKGEDGPETYSWDVGTPP